MPQFDRHLWRLAGRLAGRLTRHSIRKLPRSLDHASWFTARKLVSRLDEATDRGWTVARRNIHWQLQGALQRLQKNLELVLKDLPGCGVGPPPITQRLIYEDLLSARREFEGFQFDLRGQTLSVLTTEIELEEVYLGRFRILLDLTDLDGDAFCRVIAETPICAAGREGVPHPHVRDERLCEGDAAAPLAFAIRTGRFADFFQIIEQTLQTYNAESAYAPISDWLEGNDCHDCGRRIDDVQYYCDTCSQNLCENCSRGCVHCDRSTCDSCVVKCDICEEVLCPQCLSRCTGCSNRCCPTCLSETRCENCHDINDDGDESEEYPEAKSPSPSAGAQVYPHSLGKTVVSAGSG